MQAENKYTSRHSKQVKRSSYLPVCLFTCVLLLLVFLTACASAIPEATGEAPAAEAEIPAEEPAEKPLDEAPVEEEAAEPPTPLPTATLSPQLTQALTSTPLVEARLVEVEWPERLYLGDSDVVRMALIPSAAGYSLTTEFPDHTSTTQDVPIVRPEGYELLAIGRLDGVGFTISPAKEQVSNLPKDQAITWHWSLTPEQPGQQRLTISLLLRWEPLPGSDGITREAVAYSKGLEVQVNSFFGLSRAQTLNTALVGLALGGSVIILAGFYGLPFGRSESSKPRTALGISKPAQIREPNRTLEIENPAGLHLDPDEESLLRGLFHPYHRLLIQQEFLSGYSGARTFLLVPVRADGRSDAPTIAKLGPRDDIEREYANYEAFVKRTLPPVTARIQSSPVVLKRGYNAALQYTFIGEPGTKPVSLRQALLDNPDPKLLQRLFETFGPNWWMQRAPWTFRLAQEYDRLLPPHWILEPAPGKGDVLDGQAATEEIKLAVGKLVSPHNFSVKQNSPGRAYLTLQRKPAAGQPTLRLHWLAGEFPRNAVGRVVASRTDLLRSYVAGFDLLGLPDPLEKLPTLLNKTINGTQSTVHGDLNLENVLIGPGGMVWMIDFATTRQGHPLMDFAHLEAEIIAHVIAPQLAEGDVFVGMLESQAMSRKSQVERQSTVDDQLSTDALGALLATIHKIAFTCLANPTQPNEYWLALYMSCLGALKYRNLNEHQKYLLYLTASYLAKDLQS